MSPVREITIVQMNDSHGYLDSHQEMFWDGSDAIYRRCGGFARIAALLDEIRRRRPGQVLALDCGDTFHGTHAVVKSRGQALVPILNRLAFDGMTAHWEFAYGPQRFEELVRQLDYPMLAINCYRQQTGDLAFPPYVIKEISGLRVGVIGIAATIVDKVMPPQFSEGLRFTLGREELPCYVAELREREGVDVIVVLSHLGFPQEMKLCREVDGIDVLLSGHTHNRLHRPAVVNGTILMQSGCHGSFLGRLDLQVDGGRITGYHHELITVEESIDPQQDVQCLVDCELAEDRERLGQVVGYTATGLNRYTALESTMDNLLLGSLLSATGSQVAFSNGWRYGAPIPPGPVTLDDLYNIIPVNPPVSVCQLTGEELWNMMEENLERTFSPDPYRQMGGYVKRIAGISMYCKIENPVGQRIQEMFAGGERVRPDEKYEAVFVTSQGVPISYGVGRHQLDLSAIDALCSYLSDSRQHPVESPIRGSIVAV